MSCRSDERAGLLALCSLPPRVALFACGVGQLASFAIEGSATVAFDPSARLPVALASFAA